jgi:tetratricopeptide (TPR) repeat protein
MPVSAEPGILPDSTGIDDPELRSAFGFDRDEAWLEVAGRAEAEPGLGRIGPYELLAEAGRGSQGRVYRALQPGTARPIAIKRLGAGRFATPGMRARLDREIRALGALSHPSIVTVFGADEMDGQRFLLMEWIDGVAIDAWARGEEGRHAPPLRVRLEVFARVCDGVRHAHQRGIIHRDLKPSNILVDAAGHPPHPRILDFGLARLLEEEVPEGGEAASARTTSFVGTPAYAAPEQIAGRPHAVDTRTDVYALGAILYELLTGRPLIERRTDLPAVFEAIRSQEPRRPSSIDRTLSAELDAIVLRALAKEPDRRYPSVEAFAADVERYLAGEPVLAHPPSATYRIRKFVGRHRAGVAVSLLALAGLGAFGAYAGMQSRRYARLAREEHAARVAAEAAEDAAEAAEREAVAGRDRADRESARAASVTEFLLETLALANPDVTPVAEMSVREMLDHAAAEADSAFHAQPEAQAQVRAAIGRAYAAVGALREAESELSRALAIHEQLGTKDPAALYGILWPYSHVLAQLTEREWREHWYRLEGLLVAIVSESAPGLADAIRSLRLQSGEDPELAPARIAKLLQAADEVLGEGDPRWTCVGDALYLAGVTSAHQARDALACHYLLAAVGLQRARLGPAHSRALQSLEALTAAQIHLGRFAEAEGLVRQAMDLLAGALPADHWFLAVLEGRLGYCLFGQGRHAEAALLMQTSVDRVVASHGWIHRSVRETLVRLSQAYDALGRPEEARHARRDLARALACSSVHSTNVLAGEAFGKDHAEFWTAVTELRRELAAGSDRVPVLLDAVLAERRRRFPDEDEFSALFADQLFAPLIGYVNEAGLNQHSLLAYREVLRISRSSDILHIDKRAQAPYLVSRNLEVLGEHVEGEALARESIALGLDRRSRAFDRGGRVASVLGSHLLGQRRFEEAEKWLLEGYQLLWEPAQEAGANARNAWERLVRLYLTWGRADRLVPHVQRVIEARPAPGSLEVASRGVLVHPGLPASLYEAAFEAARLAVELAPDDHRIAGTLGMAHYRMGRFDAALALLKRSEELQPPDAATSPESLAFEALARHALGDAAGARDSRAQLVALLENLRTNRPAALRLRDEVDRALQTDSAP